MALGCSRAPEARSTQTFSHAVEILPAAPASLIGEAWTMMGDRILVVGGRDRISEQSSRAVWQLNPASQGWEVAATFPRDMIGTRAFGCDAGVLLSDSSDNGPLWLRTFGPGGIDILPLAALPHSGEIVAATELGGTIYAITHFKAGSQPRLHSLSLDRPAEAWTDLGEIGAPIDTIFGLVAQSNGERPHLFAFGSTGDRSIVAAYEPERRTWRAIEGAPSAAHSAVLFTPVGIAHVYALSSDLRIFNTVTRVWTEPYPFPSAGRPVAAAVSGTHLTVLTQGDDARARLVTSEYLVRARGLHVADYAVIVAFGLVLTAMGLINSARFRTSESYFRGGKKIPWLAAGLSVVATGQSATSFISLPARSFATNWQFSLVPLTNIFGALIMSRYFVRFFVRLNITSAYEYLQARFSPLVRTIGSLNYLTYELTRISLMILVPAVAVSAVTKIEITTAIVMMGAIATIYTTLGGLEGVVWADVVQILIKIVSLVMVIVLIFAQLEGSPLELAALAWNEGKLRAVDWSFDLTRETIWALLLFWLTDGLKSYVANQTIIQRFISTRDERSAQRSVKTSAIAGTLIFWTFLLVGTGLFLFYRQNPGRLDLTMNKPDAVFPWFIVFDLPPGATGFLITALIAAALSSLYGALNSTSTVIVTDFYRRFARNASDAGALRLGRTLTLAVGVLATGLSLLLAGLASRSLVEQTLSVIGLFGGGLGGLFLVGMLTTRVNARSALVGFVVSALVQYIVSRHTPLSWLTYMFTGMGSCFAAAYLASFLWPEKKALDGLTVHTCARQIQDDIR